MLGAFQPEHRKVGKRQYQYDCGKNFRKYNASIKIIHQSISPPPCKNDLSPALCFRFRGKTPCLDSFYAKNKIYDVTYPHDGKNHTRYINFLPQHHGKTKSHKCRHTYNNNCFCLYRHPFFLHKGFQMLFIHPCPHKPVMQFF